MLEGGTELAKKKSVFWLSFLAGVLVPTALPIDHFTVVCLVAWPLNESEAGVDLVLLEILLLFICKFLVISMRTASLT